MCCEGGNSHLPELSIILYKERFEGVERWWKVCMYVCMYMTRYTSTHLASTISLYNYIFSFLNAEENCGISAYAYFNNRNVSGVYIKLICIFFIHIFIIFSTYGFFLIKRERPHYSVFFPLPHANTV